MFQSAKAKYVTQQRPPTRGHSESVPEKHSDSPYEREPVTADPLKVRSFISGIRFITTADLPKGDDSKAEADGQDEMDRLATLPGSIIVESESADDLEDIFAY